MEKQWIFQVLLLPAIGLTRRELLQQAITLLLEEVKQITKMLGQVSLAHCQHLLAQVLVRITVQVVALAIAVTQMLHDLLLQGRDDKFYKLC